MVQTFRWGVFAVTHRMKAAADFSERLVTVENHAVLLGHRPVQCRRTVKRQLGMSRCKFCIGKLQRLTQLIKTVQRFIQTQQPAVTQTMIPLFLMQSPQQLPQLLQGEFAGVNIQIQYTSVYRYSYRDFGRLCL